MTPPNITKGEWTVAAESGQWWVVDQDGAELPDTEENARFMAASKTMAKALALALGTLRETEKMLGMPESSTTVAGRVKQALLKAGYTE